MGPSRCLETYIILPSMIKLYDRSRLGCQIQVTSEHSGTRVKVPEDGL
jgi:ferredoxin